MRHVAVAIVLVLTCFWAHRVSSCGHHGRTHHEVLSSAKHHINHKQWLMQIANEQLEVDGIASDPASRVQRSRQLQQGSSLNSGLLAQLSMLRSMVPSKIMQETASDSAPAPAPIRIHVEYQNVQSLQASTQKTLKAVMQAVLQTLQQHLSVRVPVANTLLASPMCYQPAPGGRSCAQYYPTFSRNATTDEDALLAYCGVARINPAHVLDYNSCQLEPGSNSVWECSSYTGALEGEATDLYLYVTATQDSQCNSGVAGWSRPCLFDPATNRPTLGNANVCPYALQNSDLDALVAIMVHEVIHSLGFTNALFPLFIDPTTNTQLPESSIIRTTNTSSGHTVSKIVTPNVVRAARELFGCDTLDGAQLEDEGDSGSAGSHWEYTHYQGEIMLGSTLFSAAGEAARLSPLTLGLLEDSGWYVANMTAAGPLTWARGTGCKLPTEGCKSMITPLYQEGLFCDAAAAAALPNPRYTCSASHRSVGQCRNVSFSNGCGMVLGRGGNPSCTMKEYEYANADVFGWTNGATSRCYPVTYKMSATLDGGRTLYVFPSTGNQGDRDAICYPTTCVNGQQYINIGQQQIRCPAGQMVDLSTAAPGIYRQGLIGPCPDESITCASLDCGNQPCKLPGGTCYNGKCICKLGWIGDDCSISLVANLLGSGSSGTNTTGGGSSTGDGSSGTSGGTNGGSSSESGAPPPPVPLYTQNITVWYQLIQVAVQLSATSLPGILARSNSLAEAVAVWAEINSTQVTVADVSVVPTGNHTNTTLPLATASIREGMRTGADGGAGPSTTVAKVTTVESKGMRLGSSDDDSTSSGRILITGAHAKRRAQRVKARKLAGDTASATSSNSTVTVQVAVNIRPVSFTQSTYVITKLADVHQDAALVRQLNSSGFNLANGTISYRLLIVQETTTSSVPSSPAADNAIKHAQDLAVRSASHGKSMSWTIVYIALAVAGAVVVVVGLATVIAVVRAKAHAAAMKGVPQQGSQQQEKRTQPPPPEANSPRSYHQTPQLPMSRQATLNQQARVDSQRNVMNGLYNGQQQ